MASGSTGSSVPHLDVVIVGAGPSGLAAAIACGQRGLDYEVLEKGVLVNSIYRFPSGMVFFTTPELLEIGDLPFVSPFEKPTRLEALRYYRKVVDRYELRVTTEEQVLEVKPVPEEEGGGLKVRSRRVAGSAAGAAGRDASSRRPGAGGRLGEPALPGDGEHVRRAKAVVLATGYYEYPNRLGVPGEDLPHVSHFYDQPHPYHRKQVVVVGGAHSAAEAALELYRSGAHVTLVHRRDKMSEGIKYWVLPDITNRIREGSIAARFDAQVLEITPDVVRIERHDETEDLPADAVFLLTGYHTDREFLARCGVQLDSVSCVPRYDRDTLETNVANVFLAGGVVASAHSAPVFIENGRLHGQKVVAEIARRLGRVNAESGVGSN